MKRASLIAAVLLGIGSAVPAFGGDNLAARWTERKASEPVTSAKSSLALEFCIARQIDFPAIIHGEALIEIDSLWMQQGVRIIDENGRRSIIYVANPRINDRTAALIAGCL